MCGFVTFFSNTPMNVETKDALTPMTASIIHRGPNQDGEYVDDHVYLGFRRLSILDLANGRQPYSHENGQYEVVFNGEIYNYLELREDLIKEGYEFNTNSEIEVIATLYKHYGERYVFIYNLG